MKKPNMTLLVVAMLCTPPLLLAQESEFEPSSEINGVLLKSDPLLAPSWNPVSTQTSSSQETFDPSSPAPGTPPTPASNLNSPPTQLPQANATSSVGTSSVGQPYFSSEQAPIVDSRAIAGNNVHRIWGFSGVILQPNYDDSVLLATDNVDPNLTLNTIDADQDFGGLDAYLINRNCDGRGWEMRYFGLFSDDATSALPGDSTTAFAGFANLNTTAGDVFTLFNQAGNIHSLTRSGEFNNFEVNTLRRRGNRFLGQCVNLNESVYGFRYFSLDEDMRYASTGGGTAMAYLNSVNNDLYGFQIGRRVEKNLFRKWSLTGSVKAGAFLNQAQNNQSIRREAGGALETATINAGPNLGTGYDFSDRKEDIAFLGEADLGLAYHLSQRSRLRIGYRVLGVDGVARFEDHIPGDFTDANAIQTAGTEGNLLMQGGYFGFEFVR